MRRAQDRQWLYGCPGKFRRDVGRYACQAQHSYLQGFAGGLYGKQIRGRVVLNTKHQRLATDGLAYRVAMRGQLIANGSSYQVRAVGIEPFLDQKINLAQVDIAQVNGDF